MQQMGFRSKCQRSGVANKQFKADGVLELPNDLRNCGLSDAEGMPNGRKASQIAAHEKNAGLITQDGVGDRFAHDLSRSRLLFQCNETENN